MANTPNLDLAKIASTDLLSAFVNIFNGDMDKLDRAIVRRDINANQLDSITQSGFYNTTASELVIHQNWGSTYAVQIYHRYGHGTMKFRTKYNGVWSDWHDPNGDLIWSNPNPTASFAGQTISINLSAYRFVRIRYRLTASVGREIMETYCNGVAASVSGFTSATSQFYSRDLYPKSGGVDFGNANKYITGSGQDNTALVPISIYGIV